jgi:hypothetical protein
VSAEVDGGALARAVVTARLHWRTAQPDDYAAEVMFWDMLDELLDAASADRDVLDDTIRELVAHLVAAIWTHAPDPMADWAVRAQRMAALTY